MGKGGLGLSGYSLWSLRAPSSPWKVLTHATIFPPPLGAVAPQTTIGKFCRDLLTVSTVVWCCKTTNPFRQRSLASRSRPPAQSPPPHYLALLLLWPLQKPSHFETRFPRIPVMIERDFNEKLKAYPYNPQSEGAAEETPASDSKDKAASSRSKDRSRSRSRSR